MKSTPILLSGLLATLVATPVAAQTPADTALRAKALELITPIPEKMPGAENDTPDRVALGEKLFFEKKLSMNGSQSCNSCHAVDQGKGGVDNEPTSPGALGKRGGRNSPTVLNAGFH
ncbi:MAG: cytochrome-c peroxidase, partial [Verrucomicrobia bacterium]|nr:cytochrome-c peroxidase [Verrucomicrobiota bacterium]